MPDGDVAAGDSNDAPETDATESTPDRTAAFYEAEAKKAFAARDKLKAELRDLRASGLSDEQITEYRELKQAQEDAERKRLEDKGEFEKALEKATKKHADEIVAAQQERDAARQELRSTLIGLAFAQADEWFGDSGKTVLIPEIAETYFGKYVDLQDGAVVVRDRDGDVILDATGRPAAFREAIGELIESLPHKNKILRGSGKTGSGSSGGADDVAVSTASRAEMAQRAAQGDPDALKYLRKHPVGGHSRSVWDRLGKSA